MRPATALLVPLSIALLVGGMPLPTTDLRPWDQTVRETAFRRGETLEGVLLRLGVERGDTAGIIAALRGEVPMRRIRPGERLRITREPDGRLREVAYWRTPVERYELEPGETGWRVSQVALRVETRVVALAGWVEGSLFESMERLGETPALPARFVTLFEWDFDFAADSLPGDRFRLLVEKRFVYRDFVGYGDILIAQYRSVGRQTLTAVAFGLKGAPLHHYDAEGRSVRKMFLRAPLDFTRITSGYSHARHHPVLGGVRPHLAIDYAAPPGTPARAVADGVVEAAGWRGGNGLSVTLRHARNYKTMYNHLSKITVRPSERIRQRQVIGRVGSTGLSTGPHLDYRVMKDGRFVNPLSERFVPGTPVPVKHRSAFQRQLDGLLRRLEEEASFAGPGSGGPR